MRYLPHTPEDIAEMLQAVGAGSFDELFAGIPPEKLKVYAGKDHPHQAQQPSELKV